MRRSSFAHCKVSGEAHGFVTEILEPKDKVDGWIWSIKRVRSTISYTCPNSIHSPTSMCQPTTSKATQIQHHISVGIWVFAGANLRRRL